jgi:hypothetical protein
MKQLTGEEIIDLAHRNGGYFIVNRWRYSQDALRTKLKKMARDPDCRLKFYSSDAANSTYVI